MKVIAVSLSIVLFLITSVILSAQSGEDLFKQKCSACHTVGKGKLVGPDLNDVTKRQQQDWLVKFITSSQTIINGGDEYAKKIFEENNKIIMPDAGLNEAEIKNVLEYITSQSSDAGNTPTITSTFKPLKDATPTNIENGSNFFSGDERLINGGPSCISCHNVPNATIFGGGNLALDLTTAYSRLGEVGLVNIIQTQPFPAMKQAFINTPLTDNEVYDLSAYLKNVDEIQKNQSQSNLSIKFLYSGIGGALIFIVLIASYWHNRRKRSVNYSIYKRQEDFLN